MDGAEYTAECYWGTNFCMHAAIHIKGSLLEMQSQICKKSLEIPEIKVASTSLIRPLVSTHHLPALITSHSTPASIAIVAFFKIT